MRCGQVVSERCKKLLGILLHEVRAHARVCFRFHAACGRADDMTCVFFNTKVLEAVFFQLRTNVPVVCFRVENCASKRAELKAKIANIHSARNVLLDL